MTISNAQPVPIATAATTSTAQAAQTAQMASVAIGAAPILNGNTAAIGDEHLANDGQQHAANGDGGGTSLSPKALPPLPASTHSALPQPTLHQSMPHQPAPHQSMPQQSMSHQPIQQPAQPTLPAQSMQSAHSTQSAQSMQQSAQSMQQSTQQSTQQQQQPVTTAVLDPTGRFERTAELLGRGASKEVFKAFDHEEGVEVAWNQLKMDNLTELAAAKILSEIQILQSVSNNEGIIRFYHSWIRRNDAGYYQVFFITELMTSGTLKSYLQKTNGPIKLKVIKNWARQILKALCYLHTQPQPIIHRDLKCDNIFINGNNGQTKIGDFGLAILKNREILTSVLGTPEFMAPELYDEMYDEKVDIYAFGMCLMEMVTKDYPYSECDNAAQIYRKVSQGIRPQALYKVVDDETRAFIELCIHPNPQFRPSAEQLLEHEFFTSFDERQSVATLPTAAAAGTAQSSESALTNTSGSSIINNNNGNVGNIGVNGGGYAGAAAMPNDTQASSAASSTATVLPSSLAMPPAANSDGGNLTMILNGLSLSSNSTATSTVPIASPPQSQTFSSSNHHTLASLNGSSSSNNNNNNANNSNSSINTNSTTLNSTATTTHASSVVEVPMVTNCQVDLIALDTESCFGMEASPTCSTSNGATDSYAAVSASLDSQEALAVSPPTSAFVHMRMRINMSLPSANKEVKFPFNIKSDTVASVVEEMIREHVLPESAREMAQKAIATVLEVTLVEAHQNSAASPTALPPCDDVLSPATADTTADVDKEASSQLCRGSATTGPESAMETTGVADHSHGTRSQLPLHAAGDAAVPPVIAPVLIREEAANGASALHPLPQSQTNAVLAAPQHHHTQSAVQQPVKGVNDVPKTHFNLPADGNAPASPSMTVIPPATYTPSPPPVPASLQQATSMSMQASHLLSQMSSTTSINSHDHTYQSYEQIPHAASMPPIDNTHTDVAALLVRQKREIELLTLFHAREYQLLLHTLYKQSNKAAAPRAVNNSSIMEGAAAHVNNPAVMPMMNGSNMSLATSSSSTAAAAPALSTGANLGSNGGAPFAMPLAMTALSPQRSPPPSSLAVPPGSQMMMDSGMPTTEELNLALAHGPAGQARTMAAATFNNHGTAPLSMGGGGAPNRETPISDLDENQFIAKIRGLTFDVGGNAILYGPRSPTTTTTTTTTVISNAAVVNAAANASVNHHQHQPSSHTNGVPPSHQAEPSVHTSSSHANEGNPAMINGGGSHAMQNPAAPIAPSISPALTTAPPSMPSAIATQHP